MLNEDGSTTLVDLQAVQQQAQAAQRQDDTQYVMVETPAGYQYVAVVMPEDSQQPTVELQPTLVSKWSLRHQLVVQMYCSSRYMENDHGEVVIKASSHQPHILLSSISKHLKQT